MKRQERLEEAARHAPRQKTSAEEPGQVQLSLPEEKAASKDDKSLYALLGDRRVTKEQLIGLFKRLVETNSSDDEDEQRREAARVAHLRTVNGDQPSALYIKTPAMAKTAHAMTHSAPEVVTAATAYPFQQPASSTAQFMGVFGSDQLHAHDARAQALRLSQARQRAIAAVSADRNPLRDLVNGADLATVLMEGNQRVAANEKLLSFDDELSAYDARAGNTEFFASDFLVKYLKESHAKNHRPLQLKICSLARSSGKVVQMADALSAKHINPARDCASTRCGGTM